LRGTSRDEDGSLVLGDVIQRLGDRKVASLDDLHAALEGATPGDTVRVTVLRDGKAVEIPAALDPAR
jgi:S1-C subfamily serine protease